MENGCNFVQNGGIYNRTGHIVIIIKQFDKSFGIFIKSNCKDDEQCKSYNYENQEDAKIASSK